ncbi:MAG: DUF4416 family protein [Candidatus Omnitrophica bacterium]|nr:DUF4416 family protein [Candidatus Omnitrophota bacterium]MBU1128745.1 DUF4416 family protein [Candidatus Omnitrophota bacterium]MBU1783999.1 DUF4416 family protein [Candidatus Omnitrophota bacterium]MBU1851776.1 DUF4416 family protein [Candidatus Omnitrophota bacterium]
MGAELKQKPVKLFTSIIFRDEGILENTERKLEKKYGKIEFVVWRGSFDFTDYYYPEFGRPLRRKLICFKKTIDLIDVCNVKRVTNRIEDRTRINEKRNVNIDPGYVTEAKMVLLTTKDYSHRIYVGKGIFAESTLFYRDGSFRSWPWTYPDYAQAELISYFNKVRELYRKV